MWRFSIPKSVFLRDIPRKNPLGTPESKPDNVSFSPRRTENLERNGRSGCKFSMSIHHFLCFTFSQLLAARPYPGPTNKTKKATRTYAPPHSKHPLLLHNNNVHFTCISFQRAHFSSFPDDLLLRGRRHGDCLVLPRRSHTNAARRRRPLDAPAVDFIGPRPSPGPDAAPAA